MLYSEVGSVNVPVAKVLGAEVLFATRTVVAGRKPLGQPSATQVTVTATVTFAHLEAERFEYVPDDPQLIPPLPHDFFYPFTSSS